MLWVDVRQLFFADNVQSMPKSPGGTLLRPDILQRSDDSHDSVGSRARLPYVRGCPLFVAFFGYMRPATLRDTADQRDGEGSEGSAQSQVRALEGRRTCGVDEDEPGEGGEGGVDRCGGGQRRDVRAKRGYGGRGVDAAVGSRVTCRGNGEVCSYERDTRRGNSYIHRPSLLKCTLSSSGGSASETVAHQAGSKAHSTLAGTNLYPRPSTARRTSSVRSFMRAFQKVNHSILYYDCGRGTRYPHLRECTAQFDVAHERVLPDQFIPRVGSALLSGF